MRKKPERKDDWEAWLPKYKEILGIIENPPMKYPIFQEKKQPIKVPLWYCSNPKLLAKAISKRIRGEG